MAVHFDFIVSDADAENILSFVQDKIVDCLAHIQVTTCRDDLTQEQKNSTIEWLTKHIEYLKNLRDTMAKSTKQVINHDN